MTHVAQKPADLGVAGWNALLPERAAQPALQDDVEADYLVVGAGIAGLSAARRLRQLDARASIVIIEAREIGQGPAARNSGFMIDLPHSLASGSYGGDYSADLRDIRMNRAAIAFAADAVGQWGIAASAFSPVGKVNAAAAASGERHNRDYARHLDALQEPYQLLDKTQMQNLCGSGYYSGGLWTPGTVILQPAQYVREFADALQQQDLCRLYENSPVTELSRQPQGWLLRSAGGSIRAGKVILAVNGLIESFGFYRKRLMHINLYASMTRPLSPVDSDALGGQRSWAFTPSDPLGSTLRRIEASDGDRLLIRNRCTYDASLKLPSNRLQQIAPSHDRALRARFPMLKEIEIEHRWSGRLCLSRNNVWALAELDDGLFSACCQNGLGLSKGTIAGIVSAEMAVGSGVTSLIPDYRPQALPSKLFPEPWMSLGARGVIKFKEWRAGKEM